MEKTYTVRRECDNCFKEHSFEVPVGTLRNDYLDEIKCDACGCYIINLNTKNTQLRINERIAKRRGK